MSARNKSNQSSHTQAAVWTTIVDSGEISDAERRNFHSWLDEPRNARTLSECRTLLTMIQDLPEDKAASLRRLVVPRARFPALSELFAQPLRLAGVVAVTVAMLVVGAWSAVKDRTVREYFTQTYTTGTAESRTIRLKDGTVAHLNTQSRIRWLGNGKDRRVALDRGEVLFEVAHDPQRPFRVTVGGSEIRDLATEFDVYRRSNGSVVVTVLSGEVVVKELATGIETPAWADRRLGPDQQLEYTAASLINDVHSVDAVKVVRWREGLLEAKGLPFATVINELNRYSNTPISIADPRVDAAQLKLGGTFDIHDIPGALHLIQATAPVVVTDNGDSYVLTYRADPEVTEQHTAPQQNAAGRP